MTGRRSSARRGWARAAVTSLCLVLAGTGCALGGEDEPSASASATPTPAASATPPAREDVVDGLGDGAGFDATAIYEREAAGVVTVVAIFGAGGGLGDALGGGEGGSGEGSGFVVNEQGEIVTNAHVIAQGEGRNLRRARQVLIEFEDGNRVEARILGADPNADIALLKVEPRGLELRPVPLGSSGEVRVGMPVAAIGSPFGEDRSLSVGVVSAVDRSIQSLTNFEIAGAVQTDAAINPGNSGGPLVNADGEVIGVNQQIKSTSGGGEGVGFAVPVDLVRRSVDQLREDGSAEYAYLGISSVPVYPQLAQRFELPVREGVWLQGVEPGEPAAEAGLRGAEGGQTTFQGTSYGEGGDVIVKIGADAVASASELSQAIAKYRPGQKLTVEAFRGDERRRVEVTLGERPLSDPAQ